MSRYIYNVQHASLAGRSLPEAGSGLPAAAYTRARCETTKWKSWGT